jgi:diguanylate cyclase (GGDEF)-like protein
MSGAGTALRPKNRVRAETPIVARRPLGLLRAPPVMPIVSAVFGVFLVWRAWPRPLPSAWSGLEIASVAAGILTAAGGVLALTLRPARGALGLSDPRKRLALGALAGGASAAAAAIDLLAGRSALVFVCGAIVLSLLYWDRPRFLFALLGGGALVVGLAAAFSLGREAASEQLSLAAAAAALGAATAMTMRKIVSPGVERLRSLEMENRELWDLSFHDGLTGLYNRRFAEETGRSLFARASRYRERLHVLMIDIDRFKRVNDRVSHAAGDEVIKGVASILMSCVRSSDVAARYGGDEFIVYLLEAEPETARSIANRIRDDVAAREFPPVPWQVTISVGVAGLDGDANLDSLVDRADMHLYDAKRSGRNRVSGV